MYIYIYNIIRYVPVGGGGKPNIQTQHFQQWAGGEREGRGREEGGREPEPDPEPEGLA